MTNTFIVEKNFNICLMFKVKQFPSSGQNACLNIQYSEIYLQCFVTHSD